jgi:hypothetical protein
VKRHIRTDGGGPNGGRDHPRRALRRGEPLPRSPLPKILAVTVSGVAMVATVLVLISTMVKA